jgi:hypothetical protein
MAKKETARNRGTSAAGARSRSNARDDELVALTVKVPGELYVRLSTVAATQRRTHQDICREALREYLDRAAAVKSR